MTKHLLLALTLAATSATVSAQTRTPTFRQYSARVERIRNIQVDLKSHKNARMFRTNLRNAAKEGVNFAGHYVFTGWGCGTNCSENAIIDARTGRVYFPKEMQGVGFGFCELPERDGPFEYKNDSRLLLLYGFKGGDLERANARCGIYYFEWTGTALRQLKFDRKKRTDTP